MIKVTVWNEYVHEVEDESIAAVYPNGIHNCIAAFLGTNEDIRVRTATLAMPECGLTDEVLADTDVLIWWGHCAHEKVPNEIVEKVYNQVMCGMGFVALHSAHFSKPFRRLMGTTCSLCWRDGERERVWNIAPSHPIMQGVDAYFELENEEMYGERFDVPQPDENIMIGWFAGGEVFRSGCCWNRGLGKVFYFQPGHESHPTYENPVVQRILTNAVRWAAPLYRAEKIDCPNTESVEEIRRRRMEEAK
ncbi:MAG TPA: trehalose utilization protein ThuA [Ruminococcaceae bacterium]|nr:trehalose utilization protein ThuA [Oscillospiraceae bacterium]